MSKHTTHYACPEMMEKFGGKAECCRCNGHECKPVSEDWMEEQIGQFPSNNCECHYQEPYGFVPEADCPEHDTKKFMKFVAKAYAKGYEQAIKDGNK